MLEIGTNVVIATYDSAGRFDWWCGRVQQMLCKSGGKRGSYVRTYLPVPFDEAKAVNYKIHCNFYAKSGADGVYTFKYNVDDSAPYHMESVLGLLDLNLPSDEGVYVPRDQQAGWKFDEALKLITPAADSAPHRKRARSTADDEAGGSSGAKKRALTVTLKRKGGTLGISVDPNNHQITNVVEGGAGDTAGLWWATSSPRSTASRRPAAPLASCCLLQRRRRLGCGSSECRWLSPTIYTSLTY